MAETDRYSQTLEETDDEFEYENGPEQIYGKLIKLASMASTTNIGQFVLDKVDKLLNIVETTGRWSLPRKYFFILVNFIVLGSVFLYQFNTKLARISKCFKEVGY